MQEKQEGRPHPRCQVRTTHCHVLSALRPGKTLVRRTEQSDRRTRAVGTQCPMPQRARSPRRGQPLQLLAPLSCVYRPLDGCHAFVFVGSGMVILA